MIPTYHTTPGSPVRIIPRPDWHQPTLANGFPTIGNDARALADVACIHVATHGPKRTDYARTPDRWLAWNPAIVPPPLQDRIRSIIDLCWSHARIIPPTIELARHLRSRTP